MRRFTLDKNKALEKLGLKTGNDSREDVISAYTNLKNGLEKKIEDSPMEELIKHYSAELKEIEQAYNVLLSQSNTSSSNGLSETMMRDLPIERPSYTDIGKTSLGEQPDPSIALSIGRVLAERYEILSLIDVGGMGAVYSAHDRIKDEAIAIKVLLPRLLESEEARKRFLNEAKIAASLSHPGIVNIFDVQKEGNLYFITMEKLEGFSLRAAMKERKNAGSQWSVEEVCNIGYQLCEALSFAHGTVVHRDIKPENIWLCKDNRVKIMDFGIARFMTTEQLTSTSIAMGTAYYMAPEQIHSAKNIDHRADQYSLGSVLYELLTEQVPSGRFKAPNKFRKDIPSGLSHSILKALESIPEDRFSDIAVFGARVKKCHNGFFQKYKYIAWPAIIIAVVLLSFPIWKTPVVSFIDWIGSILNPENEKQVIAVNSELSRLEIIYKNIEKLDQNKGKDIQNAIQQFQTLFQKAQSLKKDKKFNKANELLTGPIKETISVLDGQFTSLSYELKAKCESSIKRIDEKFREVENACREASSKYNTQPRSPREDAINCKLAELLKLYLNSNMRAKADGAHDQGLAEQSSKQYVSAIALLDDALEKYNDFFPWLEIAKAFISKRYDFKLEDAIDAYRNNYPFVKEPFYQKFKGLDETALNTLCNGQAEAAYKQFNDMKANLEKAKVLADRYNKYQQLLRSLSPNVPKIIESRYNEIVQQLNGAAGEIANHDFNKVSGTFDSVESNRLKLINDSMDSELRTMETKIKSGEIYAVFVSLNRFEATWGIYFEKLTGNKNRFNQLWNAVTNPVILLGGGVELKMVYIPGGTFQMGSPISESGRDENEISHTVALDGFWIGKFEITQEQYEKVMGDNPSPLKQSQNPMVNVNWYSARKFCEMLSQKTGKNFRLPTEAEWEYACRGGTITPYYWGEKWGISTNISKSLVGVENTSKNPKGLYGMCGNAWEWCGDWYGEKYQPSPQRNPKGPAYGTERVFRGGSFKNIPTSCRSAFRGYAEPGTRMDSLGFRVLFSFER